MGIFSKNTDKEKANSKRRKGKFSLNFKMSRRSASEDSGSGETFVNQTSVDENGHMKNVTDYASALQALQGRYERGEITLPQFEKLKKQIEKAYKGLV